MISLAQLPGAALEQGQHLMLHVEHRRRDAQDASIEL
jgi:hypothetical protein